MLHFRPTWDIKDEERMALSQKCGEKQKCSAFKVGPHSSFPKPFQYEETSCLGTQKILSIYFSVYSKLS